MTLGNIWLKCRKLLYLVRPRRVSFCNKNPWLSDYDVGEWSYGEFKVVKWGREATLEMGRFCSIAPTVTILLGGNHPSDWVTTYPFPEIFPEARQITGHIRTKGDVVICNDVWVGEGALILSGVTIGNGAIIAAHSVVTRNVPPYAIVAGNPARVIRERFTEAEVAELERIAWWNWPHDRIVEAIPLLLSSRVGDFIARYREPQLQHDGR